MNILYKSSRNVLGPRGACSPVGKNISDDNRYEHGAVRSNAGMLIPVSGTKAAKQRSDAGTYTVSIITALRKRRQDRRTRSVCKRLYAISKATGMSIYFFCTVRRYQNRYCCMIPLYGLYASKGNPPGYSSSRSLRIQTSSGKESSR